MCKIRASRKWAGEQHQPGVLVKLGQDLPLATQPIPVRKEWKRIKRTEQALPPWVPKDRKGKCLTLALTFTQK